MIIHFGEIMKFYFVFLLTALYAIPVYSNSSDTEYINKLISEHQNLKHNAKTYLYILDKSHINTCVSEGLNLIMGSSLKTNPKGNYIVILTGLDSVEAKAANSLKRTFLTENIFTENSKIINEIFRPKCDAELIVYDSLLREQYRDCGFRYDIYNKTDDLLKTNSSINLDDSENPIVSVSSVHLDSKNNKLFVLDYFQDKVLIFNSKTGKYINSLSSNDRLENYFIKDLVLDSMLYKMLELTLKDKFGTAQFHNLIYSEKYNQLFLQAQIIKTEKANINGAYETIVENVLIEIRDDSLGDVIPLNTGHKIVRFGKPFSLPGYIAIETSEMKDTNSMISIVKDKSIRLYRYERINGKGSFSLSKIKIKIPTDEVYNTGMVSGNNDDGIVYLNTPKRIFEFFKRNGSNGYISNKIVPSGVLSKLFKIKEINDYIHGKYPSSYSIPSQIKAEGVFMNDSNIFVYLNQIGHDKQIAKSYLQIYNIDGKFIKEIENNFSYKYSDPLLISKIISFKYNEILFLNKWKNKRWTFDSMHLNINQNLEK